MNTLLVKIGVTLFIVCSGVSTPPTLVPAKPHLNLQTVKASLFRHSSPYIRGFSLTTPLKI